MAVHFFDISNQGVSGEPEKAFLQKPVFPLTSHVVAYLKDHGRYADFDLRYRDLLDYRFTDALRDDSGKLTHWERLSFSDAVAAALHPRLRSALYPLASQQALDFRVTAIDICEYGNSNPFRVAVADSANQPDVFYVKQADTSRLLGLELVYLLGGTRLEYSVSDQTVVEPAIVGMPGDRFVKETLPNLSPEQAHATAAAFVRFCMQCYWQLLGDMRSYNFVVRWPTPNSPEFVPIDFDQQSYEGFAPFYRPQYFRENAPLVELVPQHLTTEQVLDIEIKEQERLKQRIKQHESRINAMLTAFSAAKLSESYQVRKLANELMFNNLKPFEGSTMTDLLHWHWTPLRR